MSEIRLGLRALLSHAKIYDLFQSLMGAKRGRSIFSSQYVRAELGDHVLDIGCGTAEIWDYLTDVRYVGFDPNPMYTRAAKLRFRGDPNAIVFNSYADLAAIAFLPKFDIVMATGVLHHMNDDEVVELAKLAKVALKENGRFITLDPCIIDQQSPIARFLVTHDRGQNVRRAEEYSALIEQVFGSVSKEIRKDIARFPYTHLIMECMS